MSKLTQPDLEKNIPALFSAPSFSVLTQMSNSLQTAFNSKSIHLHQIQDNYVIDSTEVVVGVSPSAQSYFAFYFASFALRDFLYIYNPPRVMQPFLGDDM